MNERVESDRSAASDAPEATRDGNPDRSGADDDADAESVGPLSRVRTAGVEAVGAVVDAVLDAL